MRSSVDIHTHLVELGVPHEFFRLARLARTPADMAAELSVDPRSFAIAHVLTGRITLSVALTSLGETVDEEAASNAMGGRLQRATPAIASLITGFPAHWVPPVAVEPDLATLIDSSLAEHPVVYGSAGESGLAIAVRVDSLLRETKAVVASITRPVVSMV
ncbi:MAG: aminoacyl-tRNA deacylase [Actinomycetota bacterium]|nr:hypothetical protein [Actinomycetota bacterium]